MQIICIIFHRFCCIVAFLLYKKGGRHSFRDFQIFASTIYCITPMHEVVPKVVAIAVSIVIAKCSIFCQSSFFIN